MTQKKCKTPGCNGFVPSDGPGYWQYCNDCGMEMEANRNKDNKICRREGCDNPVDKPYYSFCQKCFYSDAQHKKPSTGSQKKSTGYDELNPPPPDDNDVPW